MNKQRILAIDDDSEQLFMYNEKLTTHFELKTATSYPDAELTLKKFIPDLILLDISLPGKNGFDIYKELRQKPELDKTRVIFVSSTKGEEVRLHSYELGATDYVEKPFSMKELIAKININLGNANREKSLEEELEKKTNDLVQTSSLTYLGMHTLELVHNLKNILTIINGNCYIALSKCSAKNEEFCEAPLKNLSKIQLATKRIEDITHLLLDHTKDRFSNENKMIDLNQLVTSEVKIFEELRKKSDGIFIEINLGFTPAILANYSHFSQIISNLIQNSIDSLNEKAAMLEDKNFEKRISIGTTYDKNNSVIKLSFKDNGKGIPSQNMQDIFNPFFSTKRKGKNTTSGSGIGLNYVRDILRRYNGSLTVESKEDEGAEFIILLPYKPAED